jgi:hypothetical protein
MGRWDGGTVGRVPWDLGTVRHGHIALTPDVSRYLRLVNTIDWPRKQQESGVILTIE